MGHTTKGSKQQPEGIFIEMEKERVCELQNRT